MSKMKPLNGAKIAVKNAMMIKPKENVLIVYDPPKRKIAEIFSRACKEVNAKVSFAKMTVRKRRSNEPPKTIAYKMKNHDVVIAATTTSLTNTEATRQAMNSGARVISMPNVSFKMLTTSIPVDYKKLSKRTKKIADLLNNAKKIRVKTPAGTDLVMSVEGRKGQNQDGICNHPGAMHNIPAGEAGITPIEESVNGIAVIDVTMCPEEELGRIMYPIKIYVKNGKIRKIEGRKEAKSLKKVIKDADKNAKWFCEFSFGTNDKARILGVVVNDEKKLGTVHVAFGDNHVIGGKIRSNAHLDGVMSKPMVWLDDKLIMKNGKFV